MITLKDLEEAISECEGQRKPGANTCVKLAAFYTIKEHLYPTKEPPMYGAYHDSGDIIDYEGKSDFARLINGRRVSEVLPLIDDLMNALMVINPRLYNSVMRKIE